LPVRVVAPVAELKLPVMPFWLVKVSWSWPLTYVPPEIATVAPARLTSSGSLTDRPDVTGVGPLPCVNDRADDSIPASTGALLEISTIAVPTEFIPAAFPTVY